MGRSPDLLHSYFSVCGLSLCGILPPLNPLLGCSQRAFEAGRTGKGYFRPAKGAKAWSPPQAMFVASMAQPNDVPVMPISPKPHFERKFLVIACFIIVIAVIFPFLVRGWPGV